MHLIPSASCLLCLSLYPSGWASALCLRILFAPCGCRRAYCGPHCGRESARVLASLFGSSPSDAYLTFVPQFEAPSESLTHSIPRSFLVESLSTCAVGLADALWLCPERALRLSLHRSRLSIPFTMSPLSRRVFAEGISPLQAVALAEGRLPTRWVPSEPMGFAVAPPISPYTGPGQSPRFCRPPIGAQVGVSYFSCATFHMYS